MARTQAVIVAARPDCAAVAPSRRIPSSARPETAPPSPSSHLEQIEYWQDSYSHTRHSRLVSFTKIASIYGTLMETTWQLTEWDTAVHLVGSVLPRPLQGHLRRMVPGLDAAGPQASHHTTGRAGHLVKSQSQAPVQARREADDIRHDGGPQEWLPEVDRRSLEKAFGYAKLWISTVGSVAVAWGLPRASGVDWRSGSQGIDLLLSSGHEYAVRLEADYNGALERSTYISGAQHVLMGLPRDLEPVEVAMLRNVMPDTLASAPERRGSRAGSRPGGYAPKGGSGADPNLVHVSVLLCLCLLRAWALWAWPRVVACGRAAIRAEREHRYTQRLLRVAAALIQAGRGALHWFGGTLPCRLLCLVLGYALHGIMGAMCQFLEEVVLPNAEGEQKTSTKEVGP